MYLTTCNTILLQSKVIAIVTQNLVTKSTDFIEISAFIIPVAKDLSDVRFALGNFEFDLIEGFQRNQQGCSLR